ncbi:uncharacterized protein TRIADDRAFT_19972 [Trichoplax adhaerens]|uniref:3-beta hydroxysteroid dehydrogenase/isomerase domain-containing protein n=1 Tax=Trichoplax adhaerens TaxID=10228 RepID=B3RM41_TRIAD|nr:hypothetical protein TRIADDRAFT_19972 [Trichoplax adhaerens]EDV29631.1 hypothetical protein TRIADDRAFT_19972 [Trichoplax adhaerens]|eukprot:XP_002108833.1 hypothetical protein TRIADDRAFT_19972 [Trichoplax adhaerens]
MSAAANDTLVLVTGASGYLASHVVLQLLQKGYRVRGTVRSLKSEKKVKPLRELAENSEHSLELVEADLMEKECWTKAVEGCTYVCHIASPFPNRVPKNEMEIITPAVEGTKTVLAACAKSGTVKRVILTSSIVAVGTIPKKDSNFTEEDWLDPTTAMPYPKSKVLAEKAAWEFHKNLPDSEKFELVTMNPGYIQGPILRGTNCTSLEAISKMLERKMPRLPDICLSIVDVRDVAAAHIAGMTSPKAPGNRYILVSKCCRMLDVAAMLSEEFKSQGYNVPTKRAPRFLVRLASITDPSVKLILPQIGVAAVFSNDKAREELGITFRSVDETMKEMAYSVIDRGFVKKTSKYRGPPSN